MVEPRSQDKVDAIVAQWRRERPELPTDAMGILGRFGRLALLMPAAVNAVFARHGLQSGEFDVLAALRRSGHPFALQPSLLAEELMLSRAGMTSRLDRLEAAGLIRRVANPEDRRSISVELTNRGTELIDTVVTEHAANEEQLLSVLSKSDRAHLDRILRRLLAAHDR
ncbi:MarR family transcriptional regulator [Mycobacterium sp. CBMA293]|uniref:MarR family winged helix-turn-helix transcriptional regulator n=1 Tax=unclassified Mycolicibacterium TaxID=2636767 RepID=UPI0012DF020D|nr:MULTISPECIES: MarR family transcriptional regulator [unclassified Mycolicibacterium]MUL49765.1 MarR family transcriptional regulator [Mycolicibacterium sp. CBMA 360]MUL59591.1 MarR family transcriptional regulator [Mycolicibacterium sp. CBMA 335]MUL71316.1 MarR family transcriptional regulator [Mycolicibacterium sp. CBMA 311]MUL94959.1 MarR family transcriptional regulator [Mycolicibacterium sp. CBMA 230]MUM03797.1 MarR family transcriptional regulator [Mycolicibacterium sp. CBMA 213]